MRKILHLWQLSGVPTEYYVDINVLNGILLDQTLTTWYLDCFIFLVANKQYPTCWQLLRQILSTNSNPRRQLICVWHHQVGTSCTRAECAQCLLSTVENLIIKKHIARSIKYCVVVCQGSFCLKQGNIIFCYTLFITIFFFCSFVEGRLNLTGDL